MDEQIRLNRFLAERLGVSRRQADEMITKGCVRVNGQVAGLGGRVTATDRVEVLRGEQRADRVEMHDGRRVIRQAEPGTVTAEEAHRDAGTWQVVPWSVRHIYLAMNKPVGYVCSRRRQDAAPTIYELLPADLRNLKTVGRLDKDSEGLILLTNDGEFGFRMTHPKFAKHKLYEVELDRALEPLHQQMIGDFGVELKDGRSQLGLTKLDDGRRRWQVEMSEGRNRQIRRTFGALGYTVVRLKRLEFGPYRLSGLQPGEWCELTKANSGAGGKA